MTDIEIARNTELKNIKEIAENLGLIEDDLDLYGKYKAKISEDALERIHKNKKDGKLILVTAMNPTPAGEGKTTTTIGLGQGLKKIGKGWCNRWRLFTSCSNGRYKFTLYW